MRFNILSRLGVVDECDRQTDRQTDRDTKKLSNGIIKLEIGDFFHF